MLNAFTAEQASRRNNERRLREDVAKWQAERRSRIIELENDINQRRKAKRPCAEQLKELDMLKQLIAINEEQFPSA